MFDLTALDHALIGAPFHGKLHFSAVTGSTNSDAMTAARNGAAHGSVFFADEQTAGRGRGDHAWQSAAGEGLYVSVLLRPQLSATQLPLLPLAAGLASAEAIKEAAGLKVDLRWPNDLLIGERKTGGILVESKTDQSGSSFAVVGIGINVHQREFDPGLSTPGTSLDLAAGRRVSRMKVLIALLKSLERETSLLQDATQAAAIPERVAAGSTWVRGRAVEVHGPQACVGFTQGLDSNGFLLVHTDNGLVTVQTGGIRAREKD